jgi:hypothetical protein
MNTLFIAIVPVEILSGIEIDAHAASFSEKNSPLIATAMAMMSAGLVCPVNLLRPYAHNAAPNGKGKLDAAIMFLKMISMSPLKFISFFYSASFRVIGSVIALAIIITLFGSQRFIKINRIFDERG